jgi:DNA sulfur modification protein DndD
VIIFSTNTEIDERYFEELERHISHAYLVEYNKREGRSGATSGYFWKFKDKGMIVGRRLKKI